MIGEAPAPFFSEVIYLENLLESLKEEPERQRVGAILTINHDEKAIYFLGWGTLVGCEVPVSAVGATAERVKAEGNVNPKIELDNGKVVWGCECWWDNEAGMREQFARLEAEGYTIKDVDIEEHRRAFLQSQKDE